MDGRSTNAPRELARGQLWKTDDAYLQIVDLGKRLIHYKLLKDPNQPVVVTRLIRTEAMAVFLSAADATLVNQGESAATEGLSFVTGSTGVQVPRPALTQ